MSCIDDRALRYTAYGDDPTILLRGDVAASEQPAIIQFEATEYCTGSYVHDNRDGTYKNCSLTLDGRVSVTKLGRLLMVNNGTGSPGWSVEGEHPESVEDPVEMAVAMTDPCHGITQVVAQSLDPDWGRTTIDRNADTFGLYKGMKLVGSDTSPNGGRSWDLTYTGEVLASAIKWSVEPLTKDSNRDGEVEMETKVASTPLGSDGRTVVTVVVDACGVTPAGFTYGLDIYAQAHAAKCRAPIKMDANVTHTLSIWPDGGDPKVTAVLTPRHLLVVGMGDSYGSGETRADKSQFDDPNCRRGAWSAQTRAALALEQSDYHSSVTFIHVACSGATVNHGLLGPYSDPDPPGKKPVKVSQVKQIRNIVDGRKIDAVLLSIGGNDIGFADVIKTCAAWEYCPLTTLRGLAKGHRVKESLHAETQGKLRKLPGLLDKVSECLTVGGYCEATDMKGGNLGVSPSNVLQTAYPDIATSTKKDRPAVSAGNGDWYCGGALNGLGKGGITPREFEWAREVVQMGEEGTRFKVVTELGVAIKVKVKEPGLNRIVGEGPFTSVSGAYELFHGHGYCAKHGKRWVVTFTGSELQKTAPFHPNRLGYEKWSEVIAPALIKAVG